MVRANTVSIQTLRRLPLYLHYLKSVRGALPRISATVLADALGFNDVQVRKDLGSVSGNGSHGATNVALDAENAQLTCSGNRYLGLNITKTNVGAAQTNITQNSAVAANGNGGAGIRFQVTSGTPPLRRLEAGSERHFTDMRSSRETPVTGRTLRPRRR